MVGGRTLGQRIGPPGEKIASGRLSVVRAAPAKYAKSTDGGPFIKRYACDRRSNAEDYSWRKSASAPPEPIMRRARLC